MNHNALIGIITHFILGQNRAIFLQIDLEKLIRQISFSK